MRNALYAFVICLCLFSLAAQAEEVSAEDKAFIDKQINTLVKIEPTPLTGDSLEKVFSAKFFKLEIRIGASGGGMDLVVARSGDNIVEATQPGTTADMPEFKALVNLNFKLKADADAKTFQFALDQLYPIDERFDKEDLKAKTFKRNGTTWTFIRGKFFDNFKGYIVKTDANGTISSIEYSLEIKK
jgi:hypothetical protein